MAQRGRRSIASLNVVPLRPATIRIAPPAALANKAQRSLFASVVTNNAHLRPADADMLGLYVQAVLKAHVLAKRTTRIRSGFGTRHRESPRCGRQNSGSPFNRKCCPMPLAASAQTPPRLAAITTRCPWMTTMIEPDKVHRSPSSEPRQTPNEFHAIDREALDRALETTLAEPDQGRVDQVRSTLAEDGWFSAASFCSYHQQCESLDLGSWLTPPCHADKSDIQIHRGDDKALQLLKRMLRHGVSLYDPTPLASLEAAKLRSPRKR